MNELEHQSESSVRKIKAFLNKKPVKIITRIMFVILNIFIIYHIYATIASPLERLTGVKNDNLIQYINNPSTIEISNRQYDLPTGFVLYGEPVDTNNRIVWAAIDISCAAIIYTEYYDIENASYTDTCYERFKILCLDSYNNTVNKVISKYKYGEYDVYMRRNIIFTADQIIMATYEACIPAKRIVFSFDKWSIEFKDNEYFKQLMKDICFKDTEGGLIFEEFITIYE